MKIIHAADFHLDSAFASLSAEQAKERRREGRSMLFSLAAYAEREQADVLLLAGDLFDGQHVYPETLEALAKAFAPIHTRVFIAPGNHDFYVPGGAYDRVSWPENVHVFRSSDIESVELPEWNAVIYGAAFTAAEMKSPLDGFRAPRDERLHIMLLHGDVTAGDSPYGALQREIIGESGLDYLALGHVHQYSGLGRVVNTLWAYPGCIEGRGFDETGEKGFLAGDLEKGKVELRFIPFAKRKYTVLRADVTGKEPLSAAGDAISAANAEDVVRLILTGETEGTGVDTAAIRVQLAQRVYALELRDETEVRRDIWVREGEDSLRGLFLREMKQRLDAAETEKERQQAELALRYGLAALDGREI